MGCCGGRSVLRETFLLAHGTLCRFKRMGPCPRTEQAARRGSGFPSVQESRSCTQQPALGVPWAGRLWLCRFPWQRGGRGDGGGGGTQGAPCRQRLPGLGLRPVQHHGQSPILSRAARSQLNLAPSLCSPAKPGGAGGDPGGEGRGHTPHRPWIMWTALGTSSKGVS